MYLFQGLGQTQDPATTLANLQMQYQQCLTGPNPGSCDAAFMPKIAQAQQAVANAQSAALLKQQQDIAAQIQASLPKYTGSNTTYSTPTILPSAPLSVGLTSGMNSTVLLAIFGVMGFVLLGFVGLIVSSKHSKS